jgi:pantoate--beta-alanine ligase
MVRDLNINVDVKICPTVRESDGLAMSSRNVYLSAAERNAAPVLYRALRKAEELIRGGVRDAEGIRKEMETMILQAPQVKIDYIAIVCGETLVPLPDIDRSHETVIALAVRFGSTRLIDNIILQPV